ncbi:MAG TPA: Gfo/Idh/MocA family oxidoreductase [bacterium]|nr:Gfo/Idh/MocA family oxidoreductase [bacterium]
MVRLVMAGVGRWGGNVLKSLVALEGCVVEKTFDPSEEGRARARELAPQAVHADSFAALLTGSPDGVVIAAPAELHHPLALEALQRNLNVFVEKPLALNVAQGEELVRQAEERGVVLFVGHVLRYHPAMDAIRRAIHDGKIGKVLTAHTRRTNFGRVRSAENVVWSIAPHDIVNLAEIFGEWPDRVSCSGRADIRSQITDYALLTLEFPSGRLALAHVSWLDPQKKRELTVVGDRGMLLWEDAAGRLEFFPNRAEPSPDGSTAHHTGPAERLEITAGEPLARELAHFVACCRGEEKPLSDGREGLAVLRVLAAADESTRQGGAPVEVE